MQSERCEACKEGDYYISTFIGPLYKVSARRVLFIGYDAGKASEPCSEEQRRDGIIQHYRAQRNPWNGHYRGCVKVASYILGMSCIDDCAFHCDAKPEFDCALLCFAQANAVRCARRDAQNMNFVQADRICACLPLTFQDIPVLKPHVIVLQGRTRLDKPFFKLARRKGVAIEPIRQYLKCVEWPNEGHRALVVSLNHPSRGWLVRNWLPEIRPVLDIVRRKLDEWGC